MSRIAVVTGGTRGIGEAISKALKQDGYTVIATYAGNDDAAAKFKAETGVETRKWDVSDYDACALRFAADNARLNGFDTFDLLQLDWRNPPADLRMPVLLASDLIYELRNVEPIVDFIKQALAPGGLCLITDQDRVPSHVLRDTLAAEGLPFTTQIMRAGEPGGRRVKGTLYRIRR